MVVQTIRYVRAGILSVLILVVILTLAVQCLPQSGKPIPADRVLVTLETDLQRLALAAEQDNEQAAALAERLHVDWRGGRVRVIVAARGVSEAEVIGAGGKIVGRADGYGLLKVEIAAVMLRGLASLPGVRFVRRPYTPVPTVVSEGVAITGADRWHAAGIRGVGVRVAVIDVGFSGLSQALATGELDNIVFTRDYTGGGLETGSVHGTACAEIVHDMAPDAQLLLMKIGDEVDLANAVDDAISQGAQIISHSLGWFNSNFYDGTGVIADIAGWAAANGILWVNAAGNYADGEHWEGDWSDPDGDLWLDFSPGDEVDSFYLQAGREIALFLTWDGWPASDQDYDLYLVNEAGEIVASSQRWQTGDQEPTESIHYVASAAGTYGVMIYAYSAPQHPRLELYALGAPLENALPESSVVAPANAPFVFTVGAIDQRDWTAGPQERFSSQGPTNSSKYAASIVKPDICGPDGVSGYTYGDLDAGGGFWGTSASTPHVAGAAALVRSKYPGWSAADVRSFLEENAIDMGSPGKDSIYGYGRLSLPSGEEEYCCGYLTGWNLISLPVDPDETDPAAVFDEVEGTLYLYSYNGAGWDTTQEGTLTEVEGPMAAYWLWLPEDTTVCVAGTALAAPQTLELGAAGWQMIGVPFNVAWGDASGVPISVTDGAVTKTLAEAVAAGWIYHTVWAYDTADSEWIKTKVSEGTTLVPCEGYWIYTYVDDLVLDFTEEQGPLGAPPAPGTKSVDLKAPGNPPVPLLVPHNYLSVRVLADPNPVEGGRGITFFVRGICPCSVSGIRVEVFDPGGQLVWNGDSLGSSIFWNTQGAVTNGVYLYRARVMVMGRWVTAPIGKVVVLY